jgi:hypothetical protein
LDASIIGIDVYIMMMMELLGPTIANLPADTLDFPTESFG